MLSLRTQPQLGNEVAKFPTNPTNHPPNHPGKFESCRKQHYSQKETCLVTLAGLVETFEPILRPQKTGL